VYRRISTVDKHLLKDKKSNPEKCESAVAVTITKKLIIEYR